MLDASGPAFDLISIDIETLFGPDVWKITFSSGAMLNLSSVVRIEFGTLGPGWQNIAGVEILFTVIPLPTLGTHAIDFDNITAEVVGSSSIRVMDFGVGSVLTPNNYIDSGSGGSNHFHIGNFNEDDIIVADPTTLLLWGLALGAVGRARPRLR